MRTNFHERFAPAGVQPPSDRSTGLFFSAAALLVAFLWRNAPPVPYWALGVAAALALVSLATPRLLRPLNLLWFRFGLLLHKLVNPFVLLALFAIVFVPAGALMRLRYDPLRRRRDPRAKTYWIDRAGSGEGRGSMADQF